MTRRYGFRMNLREPSAVAFALRSALDPTEETASIFE